MKTELNWNSALLGKKITRDSWQRGIVIHIETGRLIPFTGYVTFRTDDVRPYWPPAGWNGKTLAEVWGELVGDPEKDEPIEDFPAGDNGWLITHYMGMNPIIRVGYGCDSAYYEDWEPKPEELDQLILALQNARVMQQALAGWQ